VKRKKIGRNQAKMIEIASRAPPNHPPTGRGEIQKKQNHLGILILSFNQKNGQ